jgi:hypothetical protein
MIRVSARYAAALLGNGTLEWITRYAPAMNEIATLLPGWLEQLKERGEDGDWAAILARNSLMEFPWDLVIRRLGLKLNDLDLEFVAYDATSDQMLLGALTGNTPEPIHTVLMGLTDDEVHALPKEACVYVAVQMSEDAEQFSVVGILPTDEHAWVGEATTLAPHLRDQFFSAASAV